MFKPYTGAYIENMRSEYITYQRGGFLTLFIKYQNLQGTNALCIQSLSNRQIVHAFYRIYKLAMKICTAYTVLRKQGVP